MVENARLKQWLDRADVIAQKSKFDCAAALDLAREIRIERIYGVSWLATQAFVVIDKACKGADAPDPALSAFDAMRRALAERLQSNAELAEQTAILAATATFASGLDL